MYNKAILIGRLVGDPELKTTQNGVNTTTVRIAVDRTYQTNGERKADFINIVCWRQTAEVAARYLTKGRLTAVSGRLQARDYTDREGHKRTAIEIVADNVYFADSRPEGAAPRTPAPEGFTDLDDDDGPLPFD